MELRLIEEYIMLLKAESGGEMFMDTRPALKLQARLTHQQIVEWLEAHNMAWAQHTPNNSLLIIVGQDWQELKELE